jgi:hypothetical protein
MLANSIRKGSTGKWGDLVMPSHGEIDTDAAGTIVDWILEQGTTPNVNYLSGIEGTLNLELPPNVQGGYFTLRAIYTDKGLPNKPEENLTGEDIIMLQYK